MDNNQVEIPQRNKDVLFENRNDPNFISVFNTQFGEGSAEKYLDETASETLTGESLVIPESHLDWLQQNKDNPDSIIAFNNMHGAGQAQAILSPTQTTDELAEEDKNGYAFDMVQGFMAGTEDVVTGLAKGGDWIYESITGNTAPALVWGDGGGFSIRSGEEMTKLKDAGRLIEDGIDYIPDAQTGVGGAVQGITSFAVPYVGIMGKSVSAAKFATGMFVGAGVDGIIMNPDDPNLTKTLTDLGVDTGIVGELLATDVDDPEWMNRARNATEGVLVGLVFEGVFWGLKATKAYKAGDKEAAAEYNAKAVEYGEAVDAEIAQQAKNGVDDAQKTIDNVEVVFPPKSEVDGQLKMDLGDAPQTPESIAKATKVPYRLTPEQIEKIKYMTRLAEGDPQEAARATRLSFNSVDTMNDYDDVLAQMAAVKEVMSKEFLEIKGGDVQRWATVKAQTTKSLRNMADLLGEDEGAFLKKMQSGFNVPYHQLAADVMAKERMLLTMEIELKELSEMINTGVVKGYQSMDEAVFAFNARREVAANILMSVDAGRSNIGRALNAMRMTRTADPKLREMLRISAENSDAKAVARAMAKSDQALKVSMQLGSKLQRGMDALNNFRINALLSGLGTQEVNMIGTAVNSVMIPLQQIMGGQVRHGVRTLYYQLASARESLKMAGTALYRDEAILDNLSTRFDYGNDIAKGKKGVVGTVISLPSRFLLTMDEFFKQSTYRGRVLADAGMQADNLGLKGKQRKEFLDKELRAGFGQNGEALKGEALLQAQRSSFTEPLEAGSIAQKFQAMGQGEGVGPAIFRFVLPFVRTPVNILSQSFQNMPVLQFASKRFRDDLRSGDPIRAAQARGKIATGAALGTLGWFLAGRGDFTGSGPTDHRIRAEWLKNNQPYSIKINRDDGSFYWISYQRFEPLANVLAVMADANEIFNDPYNEQETSKNILPAAIVTALAENTINKTFTRGLHDVFSALMEPEKNGKKALLAALGSFVPNILNQANGDEAFREIRNVTDVLQSRTGLYNNVDPKRDVLGEIVKRPTNKMDPMGLSNVGDFREVDPVMDELSRVSMQDQSAFSQFNHTIFLEGKNQSLKDIDYQDGPQSMFDKVVELTGTVKIGGITLRERLEKTMSTPQYDRAIDGKQGLGSRGTKGQIINKIITAYRNKAKSEIPEYLDLLKQSNESKKDTIESQRKPATPSTTTLKPDFSRFNEVFSE